MPQVILYSAISIDNYIARPDGRIEWLEYPQYTLEGEDFGYNDFIARVGTSIMGRVTWEQTKEFFLKPKPDAPKIYILSRNPGEDSEIVSYLRGDFETFVKKRLEETSKDVWIVGGGEIDTLALETGLIDKMIITIIPLLLGEGIKLFEGDYRETHFTLEEVKAFPNGFAQLIYSRGKD